MYAHMPPRGDTLGLARPPDLAGGGALGGGALGGGGALVYGALGGGGALAAPVHGCGTVVRDDVVPEQVLRNNTGSVQY